ncbi:DUF6516 family protein [Thiohalocapsa sp. ML1]|uniref:toxin-antitoxin system TumE family protein n=1 Tax=Thiohalocapsa sp. ML1 TaxID=1431688 RepID=UPI000B0F161A|nr:DUF6516 family protein [Thiohalocapsa sp. ML1]
MTREFNAEVTKEAATGDADDSGSTDTDGSSDSAAAGSAQAASSSATWEPPDYAKVRVWRLPHPLPGSQHPFKYSLVLVYKGECVLRYDNERGKGDHRHLGDDEHPLRFVSLVQLLNDFDREIGRWRLEHGHIDH